MSRKTVRFGITDGRGHKSETWILLSTPGTNDIYLACRALGGSLKASMHQSGAWHIAYSMQSYAELLEGLVPEEKGRFIDKWPQPSPIEGGVTIAFRIVTPWSSVTMDITPEDTKIIWVPNCGPQSATEVIVFLIAAGINMNDWPGKQSMGTNPIKNFELENGNSVWAVYHTIPMPDLSSMNNKPFRFFKGRGQSDLESDGLRAMVLQANPDGSRAIIDCVVKRKGG